MKLLLTGLPGTGKTTILQSVIDEVDCDWVISEEMRDSHKDRTGFKAKNSLGCNITFAHKTDIISDLRTGNYAVDVNAINAIFTKGIYDALGNTSSLLIFDEIGRMQMLSAEFQIAIEKLFTSDKTFLATIRYGDEWTDAFIQSDGTLLFVLTTENRQRIHKCLISTLAASSIFTRLTIPQQTKALVLAKKYLKREQYTQYGKLFDHAVRYVANNKINRKANTEFIVVGDHSDHHVTYSNAKKDCDCDLFKGRNTYADNQGECSHLQAVKLLLAH
jgi:nucleoside-triphosphatase THEP1